MLQKCVKDRMVDNIYGLVDMEIMPLSKELYSVWDEFCIKSDESWFWHTTDWLEYSLALRPELYSKQMSFMVVNESNEEILAICPLILNTVPEDDHLQFSLDRNVSIISPALKNGGSPKYRSRLQLMVFDHIDHLAADRGVDRCLMNTSPLCQSYFKTPQYNHLMRYGYLNTTLDTQVLDLANESSCNLEGMRESHRYDAKRGGNYYDIVVYDQETITKEIFDQYRLLHHKAAGRVTRPLSTFTQMYNWIHENKAILCEASHAGKPIGYTVVFTYKDGAFYASASDDPERDVTIPFSHGVQWKIILWLKKHNYKRYELGLQQWGNQMYDFPSEKDTTISFFKRGFGGETVPRFSGEKYYSKNYFSKIMHQRIDKIMEDSYV